MCPIASWGQCWIFAWEEAEVQGAFLILTSIVLLLRGAKISLGSGFL